MFVDRIASTAVLFIVSVWRTWLSRGWLAPRSMYVYLLWYLRAGQNGAVLFSDIRENCAPQMGRCGNESPELVSGMRRLMNHPVKINSANLKLMPME